MLEMRLSCSVWAMRGPMPLTNCRDVSRVSSTSEMLSAGGYRTWFRSQCMAGLKCPHENLPLHKMKLVVGAPAFMRGKVYFVPTSPATNLHALAQINYWTNVGFRIGLVVVVLNLLVESWQYLRRAVPAERLAF